eukprot:TRINITY_DN44458_c0_g1_i1.p1 TRINITY_DN44458_c0_g1~~TRINITY_DN44458_c0_g1_i1.p1  ORF type:complete len:730 (-),score=167.82 TRINITY_DN44458_c0_g1_i1:22-2157(-)
MAAPAPATTLSGTPLAGPALAAVARYARLPAALGVGSVPPARSRLPLHAGESPRQPSSGTEPASAAWRLSGGCGLLALATTAAWRRRCGTSLAGRKQALQLVSQRRTSSAASLAAVAADEALEIAGNFVEDIVAEDLNKGTHSGRVATRFPPEPNGHLHIGHAKSICLNFGIAQKFGGVCTLRFDDTNPATEKMEYIESIQRDVRWLGFDWHGAPRYTSDYFPQLHSWALEMIKRDWAYVDELSAEEISQYRGSLTTPGKDSPYRNRPIEESLELFEKMRAGQVEPGKALLRAKIDMQHRNVIMRDPFMYRVIKDTPHPRTGSEWCIYPSYDWAHGLSDAIENVTHSVCTLEFNMHNELYDWFNARVKEIGTLDCTVLPHQYEFARLEMTHIVVSKRKLKRLVEAEVVSGWDDPRMPTLSGMRRRGYPPSALRKMCELVGVTKTAASVIRYELLDSCVRNALQEEVSNKLLCVLRPLRVVVTNWEGEDEVLEVAAEEGGMLARRLPFGKELLIEQEDFMEEPVAGFKRLVPGGRVKLRYGYVLTCDEVVKAEDGSIAELRCTYDAESLGKRPPKKVAVVHWAHATASVPLRVRLYDKLFVDERPEEREEYMDALNPKSLEVLETARCEPTINEIFQVSANATPPTEVPEQMLAQFERCGYFAVDEADSAASLASGGPLVLNRTIALQDSRKPGGKPGGKPAAGGKKGGKGK